ncbi:hypothetical protein CY35_02G152300 [Sphagnum magellanicum]|nr:hypothetical protein CY35_02G152300 [Sphagnum magellanicum]
MILPFAKLGALMIKTLGKPLATRMKVEAAKHPWFRQLIINFAQSNHRMQVNIQRRIYGHDTNVAIHPLNEDKAVQDASEILGEFIIFGIGGALVIMEVSRSSRSEAIKEGLRKAEIEALRQADEKSEEELQLMRWRLEELERELRAWRGALTSWIPDIRRSPTEEDRVVPSKPAPSPSPIAPKPAPKSA